MGKRKSFDIQHDQAQQPHNLDRMSMRSPSTGNALQGYDNPALNISEDHSPNSEHSSGIGSAQDDLCFQNSTNDEVRIEIRQGHAAGKAKGDLNGNPQIVQLPSDKMGTLPFIILETEHKNSSEANQDDNKNNFLISAIIGLRSWLAKIAHQHKKPIKILILALLVILYFVYFGFALAHGWNDKESTADFCHGVRFLFLITMFSLAGVLYFCVLKRLFGKTVDKQIIKPVTMTMEKLWRRAFVRWLVYAILLGGVVAFLIIDSANDRQRLVSAAGVVILVFIGFVFSKCPGKIIWRQVFWGLGFQFVFALLILRWNVGRRIFGCLGDKISTFLNFTDSGSSFVFSYLVTGQLTDWPESQMGTANSSSNDTTVLPFGGKLPLQLGIFAFKVLPVIFFFSFFISVLYYYGIMQWIVTKLGWLLQVTVGTTAAESINAAANIFVGQTEAPLVIQPFLSLMTKSELHAVMTGGFATIAGGVLAAYINFGVSASHLLSASVMSAPAALGFSKLFYPETEVSQTTADNINIGKGSEKNALEAAANGATNAIGLIANIVANLIAFIAFIAFLNFLVSWFAALVGYEYVTFEWILSKLFVPLAFIMGVDWSECDKIAKLIGLKTVVNEFVAYAELAQMLQRGELSARAEAIATYALCGFSNISSMGVQLGGLGAMAPHRRSDLADIALRALISGSIACFMTACIAGTLIDNN